MLCNVNQISFQYLVSGADSWSSCVHGLPRTTRVNARGLHVRWVSKIWRCGICQQGERREREIFASLVTALLL